MEHSERVAVPRKTDQQDIPGIDRGRETVDIQRVHEQKRDKQAVHPVDDGMHTVLRVDGRINSVQFSV